MGSMAPPASYLRHRHNGTRIQAVGIAQCSKCHQHIVGALIVGQNVPVDHQRFDERRTDGLRRGQQALHRIGNVVRLVDHVGGIEWRAPILLGDDQFIEYQKQLVRIDRARIQIIVAVFRVVEMKSA